MASDIFGSFAKEYQNSGDSGYWGGVKNRFNNGPTDSGMFELHLTKNGSYGKFGTGGAAIGINGTLSALSGLDEAMANIRIGLDDDRKNAITLRVGYSNGSSYFEDIITDKRTLEVGGTTGEGETITKNGITTMHLGKEYGTDKEDQLRLAVLLEHESSRNGEVTDTNVQETVEAVLGHTEMAIKLASWFGGSFLNDNMRTDIKQLNRAMAVKDLGQFAMYAATAYDSSADFWKLIKHTDGSTTMIDDESDDVTIVDEATGESDVFKYTGGSRTGFIGESIGITRDEVIKQMGPGAGWTYADGNWGNNRENQTVAFTPGQTERINARFAGMFPEADTFAAAQPVNEPGFFGRIGQSIGNFAASLYNGAKNLLGLNKYEPEAIQAEILPASYYENGNIDASDLITNGRITENTHENDTHYVDNWYTKGHPAVDIVGEGAFSFPYNLDLLKTGKNENRLLYQLSGKDDYLYFTHIDSADARALQILLDNSDSGSVFFKAGSDLFNFPTELDDYSTGLHIHGKMYKLQNNGSYGFANMLTGNYLPDFDYMHSGDGLDYYEWMKKLPSERGYWK